MRQGKVVGRAGAKPLHGQSSPSRLRDHRKSVLPLYLNTSTHNLNVLIQIRLHDLQAGLNKHSPDHQCHSATNHQVSHREQQIQRPDFLVINGK
jgi:hypothetical protein